MKKILYISVLLILCGCQKEKINVSGNTSDVFFVDNAGASMRVLVEGNTLSNTFILLIHGGPGVSAYFYNTEYVSQHIEDKYAMVYWDQRDSGASQGNSNGDDLHLDQMADDLKKVIQVLKYRYGENISLFLLGHSFGGLLAADFLTTPGNQDMVKGYIDADGSHNYPLNDTLTREALLKEGCYQVSQNINVDKWQDIINYCNSHTGNFTFEQSQQLEDYATDAEDYIDSIKHVNMVSMVLKYSIEDNLPLTSILMNYLFSSNTGFNKELSVMQYSSSLGEINVPVLLLWGKYDFTCPLSLGMDFYNRISSTDKKIVISPQSGHTMIFQDEKLFCDAVCDFVKTHR